MKLVEENKEVEVQDIPLLEDLLHKWGYTLIDNKLKVKDIDKITCELSAWGIPWKRTKWDY